jgi:hypothetical protein
MYRRIGRGRFWFGRRNSNRCARPRRSWPLRPPPLFKKARRPFDKISYPVCIRRLIDEALRLTRLATLGEISRTALVSVVAVMEAGIVDGLERGRKP